MLIFIFFKDDPDYWEDLHITGPHENLEEAMNQFDLDDTGWDGYLYTTLQDIVGDTDLRQIAKEVPSIPSP